jgi:hypothetical protein
VLNISCEELFENSCAVGLQRGTGCRSAEQTRACDHANHTRNRDGGAAGTLSSLGQSAELLELELSRPVEQRATPYEIANAIGIGLPTLKAYFPALMDVLFSDWRQLRRVRTAAKEARNVSLVLERATARLAGGLPVSGKAIARDLGRRNLSLLKDERRALDDLLANLR